MHLLSTHKAVDSIQYLLFSVYRLFLPLMLSDILSFSSYFTPTSDPHTIWINSTFSTRLRTQVQNLYSDALNDTESLTKILPQVYLKHLSHSLETTQILYHLIS